MWFAAPAAVSCPGGKAEDVSAHAERLAAAGATVLVFDHRHLGDSPGEHRQRFRKPAQREDWRAAVRAARAPRAELHRYPYDHWEPWAGDAPERIAADQIDFLRRQGVIGA